MCKKLFFLSMASVFLFLLPVVQHLLPGDVLAEDGQRQPNQGDPSAATRELIAAERQSPANAGNVQERYRQLGGVISSMLHSGMPVDRVLSREEARRIESLLGSGGAAEAARLVHDAVLKLEDVNHSGAAGAHPGPQPGRAASAAPTVQSLERINIKDLITRTPYGNILKLGNPVVDAAKRRLYISGTKSTSIGVVDLDSDELVDTFDIGMPGGFMFLDPRTHDLYLFDFGSKKTFKVDIVRKMATEAPTLPSYLPMPRKGTPQTYRGLSFLDSGYPFKVGYLQDENAAYGVINIKDASGNVVSRIKHGPDGLYFDIDPQTGKLYSSNTGDGTISVFDLNGGNRKIKDIRVGISVDEIALNADSTGFYTRDRLGGNLISFYDMRARAITTIPNENAGMGTQGIGLWPTDMVYDGGMLYVLSHYAGRIDVIDTISNRVVSHIPLGLAKKPRTDNLSAMIMDRKGQVLYAAFPELGTLAVVDAKGQRLIRTIQIENFDIERTNANPSPGKIVLAFNEKMGRLYVYMPEQQTLHAYDAGSYRLVKTAFVSVTKAEHIMTSNPEKGVLYLGDRVLDAETLAQRATFPYGDRVVAFDNSKNRVYLSGAARPGPSMMSEHVYEYEDMVLKRQWPLSPVISIQSSFSFDFRNRRFCAAYFEAAVVEVFDLNAGEAPANLPNGHEGRGMEGNGRGGDRPTGGNRNMGGQKGRCGDGICQPIEQQRGVCPEDCNK
ncbi:MAG: YncE family protein [Deltaproteobacteria bacterium]|nr:YncE family protein [Deltaproteobacteria bacterium]